MDLSVPMGFDCAGCPVRGRRCDDCVVPAFLALPTLRAPGADHEPGADGLPLLPEERATVSRLVAAGLVAPEEAAGLRAVPLERSRRATG